MLPIANLRFETFQLPESTHFFKSTQQFSPIQLFLPTRIEDGFTILEILLVGSLAALLCTGFLSLFVDEIRAFHDLNKRSESLHQVRTGLESLVNEIQDADYYSLQLLEPSAQGVYSEVRFMSTDSQDIYWYYVGDSYNLIRAIKHPGHDWGRNTVAEGIGFLRILQETNSRNIHNLVLELGATNGKISVKTTVSHWLE